MEKNTLMQKSKQKTNEVLIQFNSIQLFIIYVLSQQL
jgi:hypothetical protein